MTIISNHLNTKIILIKITFMGVRIQIKLNNLQKGNLTNKTKNPILVLLF